MRFVKANPSHYLVVGRRGRIRNRGPAASAFLWPGSSSVLVPSTKQEAKFEMTQESRDGVPLRFKGIVVFRITEPEVAASLFNFSEAKGVEEIKGLIADICLGELRAVVAHLSMLECIEQRKTTLSHGVARVLQAVVEGRGAADAPRPGRWGIELDLVQVAQVFIVDGELRRQLDAEVRDKIRATSERSGLRAREEVERERLASERRIQEDALATQAQRFAASQKELELEKELERAQIEEGAPVRQLRVRAELSLLPEELEVERLRAALRAVAAQTELALARAESELRKELLPLEQLPELARALGGVFKGASLTSYGEGLPLEKLLAPLVERLARALERKES